ncbi:hypothetical protein Poly24_12010 [Rosistilla carotiformis]|uniref:Bacterial Ig-like domain (Group 2) n=1 Tax=Rosistilla carotiformis TaxID=2528017 RepID=A0A518JPP3_9BACT|nr:DUF1549 domain-containing protein [Rosistilla carotiformis]QDV67501.1 hypothetical protein Poly24_12010 [Rosistilla carotiformis]
MPTHALPLWMLLALWLTVQNVAAQPVSFELEVQPILAARGCSTGPCHGKQNGQNGFQLSLLGFDSNFDYNAIARDARGRRVFPTSPRESLLLLKATGELPHGGGRKLDEQSAEYRTLLRWIESGMPRNLPDEPSLDQVTVSPTQKFLKPGESLPLVVTAHYSNGTQQDVTAMAMYQSNESATVAVGDDGVVRAGSLPGEAAIMVRYMNVIATCNVAIPLAGDVPDDLYADLPRNNFIDDHVWNKLQSLGITPSASVDDAKFMRRVYTDIIGRLPTADEATAFLNDPSSTKRLNLIDDLLQRPEYAEHWANKWADLLRPNPYRVGIKAVLNYDLWIRERFRKNVPWDQFVRELLTAQGSTFHNGAVTLFRDRRSPDELTTITTQLFLGIRLECAKCHHHPFEKWSQHDFYSFASYFAGLGRKGTGVSPPISGSEEIVYAAKKGTVNHPTTGASLAPAPLFGTAEVGADDKDTRVAMAAWITSPENDYFAQTMANRIWADMMGRGIVEPVDDLRATNPPSNGPLLDALADHFRESGFDIQELIRAIAASAVYSLDSVPNERNVGDTRNFSRRYRQRLRAEVLMDSVAEVTGVEDNFTGMPAGSRAKEIWTHRITSQFLDAFGRPDPNQDPPCERQEQTTVTQTLHLMNSKTMQAKITSDSGRAADLSKSDLKPEEVVRQLYLSTYSRLPDDAELEFGVSLFSGGPTDPAVRRDAIQDLMWALLNTPEFMFKD